MVLVFNLQTITTSFESLFFLQYCLNFHLRSYLFVGYHCLYFGNCFLLLYVITYKALVVCCLFLCRMFVLCCVPVEPPLFVVAFPSYQYAVYIFKWQTIATRFVGVLSVVLFEFTFWTVNCP